MRRIQTLLFPGYSGSLFSHILQSTQEVPHAFTERPLHLTTAEKIKRLKRLLFPVLPGGTLYNSSGKQVHRRHVV